jgi:hypothetical protein
MATHQAHIVLSRTRQTIPLRPPKRIQRIPRNRGERLDARHPCLPLAIRLHRNNDQHGAPNEHAAEDPELLREEDEAEEERLEAEHRCEAADDPDVEEAACLAGVCAAVDVGNEVSVCDEGEEYEEDDGGTDERED